MPRVSPLLQYGEHRDNTAMMTNKSKLSGKTRHAYCSLDKTVAHGHHLMMPLAWL